MTPDHGTRTTLFDPATTEPRRCTWPSCRTERPNLCRFEADREHGLIPFSVRRPKGCLKEYDPKTASIPF